MSEKTYQVKTNGGISKPYTLEKLIQKQDAGHIDESAQCSSNGGLDWSPLSVLLKEPTDSERSLPKSPLRRLSRKRSRPSDDKPPVNESDVSALQMSTHDIFAVGAVDNSESSVVFGVPDDDTSDSDSTDTDQPPSLLMSMHDVFAVGGSDPAPEDSNVAAEPPAATENYSLRQSETSVVRRSAKRALEQQIEAQSASSESSTLSLPPDPPRTPRGSDDSGASFRSGPQAASDALGNVLERKRIRERSASAIHDAAVLKALQDSGESARSGFVSGFIGGVVAITLAAVGLFVWWKYVAANPPEFASLIPSEELALFTDERVDPMPPRELTARMKIMSVQLRRVAREVAVDVDQIEIPSVLKSETVSIPLLPYSAVNRIPEQQLQADNAYERYERLVSEKSADGRVLAEQDVNLVGQYLATSMALPGGSDATRQEAVEDLAYKAALLYLLQLGNLQARDAGRNQTGRDIILKATDAGLKTLYPEFAIGDLRFSDLLINADASEQVHLILVRYWYFRTYSRKAADEWLTATLTATEHDASAVRDAVSQIDRIE